MTSANLAFYRRRVSLSNQTWQSSLKYVIPLRIIQLALLLLSPRFISDLLFTYPSAWYCHFWRNLVRLKIYNLQLFWKYFCDKNKMYTFNKTRFFRRIRHGLFHHNDYFSFIILQFYFNSRMCWNISIFQRKLLQVEMLILEKKKKDNNTSLTKSWFQ